MGSKIVSYQFYRNDLPSIFDTIDRAEVDLWVVLINGVEVVVVVVVVVVVEAVVEVVVEAVVEVVVVDVVLRVDVSNLWWIICPDMVKFTTDTLVLRSPKAFCKPSRATFNPFNPVFRT